VKRKNVWRKEETQCCEIESVVMPKIPGGSIIFNLTPRGARFARKYERHYRIEQARIKRFNANHISNGILWHDWLFSFPFC
jgi:hypothetical protein